MAIISAMGNIGFPTAAGVYPAGKRSQYAGATKLSTSTDCRALTSAEGWLDTTSSASGSVDTDTRDRVNSRDRCAKPAVSARIAPDPTMNTRRVWLPLGGLVSARVKTPTPQPEPQKPGTHQHRMVFETGTLGSSTKVEFGLRALSHREFHRQGLRSVVQGSMR